VHLELAGEARAADAERAQTLVRVAQEGLTNAARHSGADNVWVTLDAEPGALRLAIEDDGPCRGELRAGHGLTGLRERVEELGGRVELGRGPRGGLRVVAWVPQGQAT
jgi:signal transduction histidine kinase